MPSLPDRSPALGDARQITVGSATLQWFTAGPEDGPAVVFVHGLLVNADLWRNVVPALAKAGVRCVSLDLPLGGHRIPVPDQPLDPPAVADLLAGFLEALDLRDATVVANDTGGALTQLLMIRHPERLARVVLTPSDCFDRFLPQPFTLLPVLVRIPGVAWAMTTAFGLRAVRRSPFGFGWLSLRMPDEVGAAYLASARFDPAIRRDMVRFVRAIAKRHTLNAAKSLPEFGKPVILAWAQDDRVFPISLAHRLAQVIPQSRLVLIPDSRTFVPEDNPEALIELLLAELAPPVSA